MSLAFNVMKMKARHWLALIPAIAVIFVFVHIGRIAYRNVQYHHILRTYSDALKPGMKRSEVENYFIMSKYVAFNRFCCVGPKRGTFDDLVEIGREKKGWVCQEQVVYAAFEFAASGPTNRDGVGDSDRLVTTSLYRSDCLDLP